MALYEISYRAFVLRGVHNSEIISEETIDKWHL